MLSIWKDIRIFPIKKFISKLTICTKEIAKCLNIYLTLIFNTADHRNHTVIHYFNVQYYMAEMLPELCENELGLDF